MRSILSLLFSAAVLCCAANSAFAATPPAIQTNAHSLTLTQLADFAPAVNDLTTPKDDATNRLFVVGQNGNIFLIKNGVPLGTSYLQPSDITNFSGASGERGLLGLAFSPDFNHVGTPGYGKFYTYSSQNHTANNPSTFFNNTDYGGGNKEQIGPTDDEYQNVLTEWTTTTPGADTFSGTSRVVFSVGKIATNHNGGGIAFGTAPGDTNNLYIALGDGGNGDDHGGSDWTSLTDGHTNNTGNAQDKNVVYGKILRINPLQSGAQAYTVPASNPFVGATPGLDEIFAYGFRNPFRFSFDPATNDLYAGDVGQSAREEIDKVTIGGNYGWVNKEGSDPTPGLPGGLSALVGTAIDPISEYVHPSNGAVIGGYVNRGPQLSSLTGDYIFGDLTGHIYYLNPASPSQIFEFQTPTLSPTLASGMINGFGRDQAGNLFMLLGDGRVFQLIPEPSTGMLAAAALGLLLAIALVRRVARNRRAAKT